MIKYVNTEVVFQEIPDETTLAINIAACPCRCPGCHSPYLWEDAGQPLTPDVLERFIDDNDNLLTCICLMGGDAEPESVDSLAAHLRQAHPEVKTAWYSGRQRLAPAVDPRHFNYIKLGPYIRHLGPLKQPTTNQRLYTIAPDGTMHDITSRFWRQANL